ncbi:hypothetical protein OHA25_08145 [Nonomuraea sp. NBC_00507]|uniref:hypothetical protein n=1 Tax=Nonomuraea sp. NBC_00507 TaxID=2976002 RepID=UPI002E18C963
MQTIVADLRRAGHLTRERIDRRNRYSLNLELHLRHPAEAGIPVGLLIALFTCTARSIDRHSCLQATCSTCSSSNPPYAASFARVQDHRIGEAVRSPRLEESISVMGAISAACHPSVGVAR